MARKAPRAAECGTPSRIPAAFTLEAEFDGDEPQIHLAIWDGGAGTETKMRLDNDQVALLLTAVMKVQARMTDHHFNRCRKEHRT